MRARAVFDQRFRHLRLYSGRSPHSSLSYCLFARNRSSAKLGGSGFTGAGKPRLASANIRFFIRGCLYTNAQSTGTCQDLAGCRGRLRVVRCDIDPAPRYALFWNTDAGVSECHPLMTRSAQIRNRGLTIRVFRADRTRKPELKAGNFSLVNCHRNSQFLRSATAARVGEQPAILRVILILEERPLPSIAPLCHMVGQSRRDHSRKSCHSVAGALTPGIL